jgi:hypothetical protein
MFRKNALIVSGLDEIVDIDHMIADKPNEIGKVRSGCFVPDKFEHGLVAD